MYKGFSKIENLTNYTGLKSLWLEGNGIDKIENLGWFNEIYIVLLMFNVNNISNFNFY